MKMLARAAIVLSALLACAPSMAQHASDSWAPAGRAPEQTCVTWTGATVGAGTLVPCPSSGFGGSGGAVTAAPGAFQSGYSPDLGTPSDAPYTGTGNGTLIATLKGVVAVTTSAATAATNAANTAHADAQATAAAATGAKGTLAAPSFTTGQADQRLVCLAGSGASCNTAVSIAANASATAATFAISATYGVSCIVTGPVKLQLAQPDGSYADSGLAFSGNGSGGIFITAGPSGQAARIVDTSGAANTALCQATS